MVTTVKGDAPFAGASINLSALCVISLRPGRPLLAAARPYRPWPYNDAPTRPFPAH